jgi:hypothetical protein
MLQPAERAIVRYQNGFDSPRVSRDHHIHIACAASSGPSTEMYKGRSCDAFQMIVCPAIVGGGKRFFPDGVRLDLELLGSRSDGSTAAWSSCGTASRRLLVGLHWA